MATSAPIRTIVVGSGLAGLTTTLSILQASSSHKVILLDKCSKLGGNSIKASSGINGVPTQFQNQMDHDSIEEFYKDTIKSGKGLNDPKLATILTNDSKSAISWLVEDFQIDLSEVTQLGGHSHPRTHKGKKLPPGFAIVSTLIKKLQQFEIDDADKIDVLRETELTKIIYENGKIKGIEYKQNDSISNLSCDNLVLATGGFSADSKNSGSLLSQYRPDLLKFPTSNGVQTTGDGQKLAVRDCNAKLIDMDKVQIHPTGFVKLDSPTDSWKFLCGELLRGIGGVLLNLEGERFTNELNTRDKVTESILRNCKVETENEFNIPKDSQISIIVISEEDYPKAKNHIDFYKSQNLLMEGNYDDLYQMLKKLNPKLSLSIQELKSNFQILNTNIENKSDAFGRQSFGNEFNQQLYFGLTTPVLHFTMGGIQTDIHSNVVTNDDHPIPNLYAIGEVSGGVHGANRLGGSSLLECVVFGKRVASHIVQ